MNSRLRTGRLSARRKSEDLNPMDGLANLADCMLVFACGLMLSLMVNWNVISDANKDALKSENKSTTSDVQEIDNVSNESDSKINDSAKLQKAGTVYVDPDTGKWYFKEN